MATTKDRIEELEALWTVPAPARPAPEAPEAVAPPASRPRPGARLTPRLWGWLGDLRLGGRMAPGTALVLALGWVAAVVTVSIALPPPPPARVAPDPALIVALNQ